MSKRFERDAYDWDGMELNGLAGYGRGYMRPGMEWWVGR